MKATRRNSGGFFHATIDNWYSIKFHNFNFNNKIDKNIDIVSIEDMYYIYKISCLANDKVYFGQTNNPSLRWSQHKHNAKINPNAQVISRAMAKYGVDQFRFEIVNVYESRDAVNIAEEEYIQLHDARNPQKGYNVDVGGNVIPRPASIGDKISKSLKKHYETHDSRLKGKKLSDEFKRKLSELSVGKPGTNKGKVFDDDWRIGIAKSLAGKDKKKLRRFSDEQEKEICRLYVEEELTIYKLAQKYEASRSLIITILDRNCVSRRKNQYTGHQNGRNIFTKTQELEICEIYKIGNSSIAELSRKYSCGKATLREILLRNGVKL